MKIDDDLFQARQADHAAVNINPSQEVSPGTILHYFFSKSPVVVGTFMVFNLLGSTPQNLRPCPPLTSHRSSGATTANCLLKTPGTWSTD